MLMGCGVPVSLRNMSVCKFVLLFRNRYEFDETFEGSYYRYQKSLEKNTCLGLMPSHLMDVKDGAEDIMFLKEEKPKWIKIKSENTTEIKKELRVMIKHETSLKISAKKLIAKSRKGVAVKVECDIQRKAITALIASQTISAAQVASKAKASRWIQNQCNVCGEICPSKRAVLRHIKSMHSGTKWACSYCGKEYRSFNSKYKHEISVHEKKKIICGICGHGFDYKSQVDLHTPVHSPASKVYCETCGKGFASD